MARRTALLFGNPRLSFELAAKLGRRNFRSVIAASDERSAVLALNRGFEVKQVDHTDDNQLRELWAAYPADMLFSLFSEDAQNAYLIISARALDANIRVLTIAESPDSIPKLTAAGADKVIDPHELSGSKIWAILKRPLVAEVLDSTLFGQSDLRMTQLELSADSVWIGQGLADLSLAEDYNLVLLGVVSKRRAGALILRPKGRRYVLERGDVLILIGPQAALDQLRCELPGGAQAITDESI
jgi:voltage-gated potassium channel